MTPQVPSLVDLQGDLAAIIKAIGSAVSSVRYPDGRSVTFRSMAELQMAKTNLESRIAAASGGAGSKSVLAQHRRGDGPFGPGGPGPGNPGGWGYW